jgi:hypothetical protein
VKEIRTEIDIKASPEKTWKILTDFERYQQWNPIIRHISGASNVGSDLEIHIQTPKGKNRNYRPRVTKVDPFRELRWYGKSFIPGLFNGERIFTIEPLGSSDRVHFVHTEIFTGLIVALIGNKLDKDMHESFLKMNNSFKQEVEKPSI